MSGFRPVVSSNYRVSDKLHLLLIVSLIIFAYMNNHDVQQYSKISLWLFMNWEKKWNNVSSLDNIFLKIPQNSAPFITQCKIKIQ